MVTELLSQLLRLVSILSHGDDVKETFMIYKSLLVLIQTHTSNVKETFMNYKSYHTYTFYTLIIYQRNIICFFSFSQEYTVFITQSLQNSDFEL